MRIASIENENGVSGLINSHFNRDEIVVEKIESIDELLFKDCSIYDLILVDMTHKRCLQFIQDIKQQTNIPVIYDKDFVIHSFTREEFIDEIFKKVEELSKANVVDFGECTLDEENGIFKVGNKMLNLTRSEFAICTVLVHNMPMVLSKEAIVDEMEKEGINTTPRSVREHIKKIRQEFRKADLEPIDTITSKGYRWTLNSLTTL